MQSPSLTRGSRHTSARDQKFAAHRSVHWQLGPIMVDGALTVGLERAQGLFGTGHQRRILSLRRQGRPSTYSWLATVKKFETQVFVVLDRYPFPSSERYIRPLRSSSLLGKRSSAASIQ